MFQWPRTVALPVKVFTSEELALLLSKATTDEADLIHFFLCTGLRDDETAHACYSEVNHTTSVLTVTNKPEIGFSTKNGKERPIPVPAGLLERLKARRERNPKGVLIFPNTKGTPDSCLLARVRKAGKRAGMDPKTITLHKFRKTFGTRYAEKHGVRNAKELLGHASIVTTEKYLAKTDTSSAHADELFADVVGK